MSACIGAIQVGPLPLTSLSRPHRIHLMSLTWWMRSSLPRFSCSSASVYYPERKPKNENGGGLGTRLAKTNSGLLVCKIHHTLSVASSLVHNKSLPQPTWVTVNLSVFAAKYNYTLTLLPYFLAFSHWLEKLSHISENSHLTAGTNEKHTRPATYMTSINRLEVRVPFEWYMSAYNSPLYPHLWMQFITWGLTHMGK